MPSVTNETSLIPLHGGNPLFRNRRWASLIALFLPLALVAAACGDDDDAGETTDTTADNGGDDGAGDGFDPGTGSAMPTGMFISDA